MRSQERFARACEQFAVIRRLNLELIDAVAADKRTVIPSGFRNHVFWHAGHLVTVQASLLYARSGLALPIDESYLRCFAKGTSPSDFDDSVPTWRTVRTCHDELVERVGQDIDLLHARPYTEPVVVSTGHTLASALDAMEFLPIHESYHRGFLKAMLKLL